MTDPVRRLVEAIDRRDREGIRAAYAPGARLVTMTPDTFGVATGPDAVADKLTDWFGWGDDPSYAFLGTVREGDRAVVEFERANTLEGAGWVVRQAHVLEVGPAGIVEHRAYCTGPREGERELAAAYGAPL